MLAPLWLDRGWARAAWWVWLLAGSAATVLAGVVLLGWLVPPLGRVFPAWWLLMQPNVAVSVLALGVSLLARRLWVSVPLVLVAFLLAGSALVGRDSEPGTLETVLDVGVVSASQGVMAVQSAWWIICACILALLVVLLPGQHVLISLATLFVVMFTAVLVIANLLSAGSLLGQSKVQITSPMSSVTFMLLTTSWVAAWMRWGAWRPVLERGIAAVSLRWLIGFSLVVPLFAAVTWQAMVDVAGWAAAVATAVAVSLVLVAALAGSALLFRRMRALEGSVRRQAVTDETTGLLNQGAYWQFGSAVLQQAARAEQQASIIVYDLDGLKQVNDQYGHEEGTKLLVCFATALRAATRGADLVARIGGD